MKKYFLSNCALFFILSIAPIDGAVALGGMSSFAPPLYKTESDKTSFRGNYTILNQIAEGTYSSVFLCSNSQGDLVAVKQYAITDQALIDIFEQNGISVEAYIKQLALTELEIGQLTDHPNIVKVKEVFLEPSAAYVVMDYVDGKPFDHSKSYSAETRVLFTQQLLSAIEHLLLRNVIIDDFHSGNILISNHSFLTLIDLGGNEIINRDASQRLKHYLGMIEHMIGAIGGDAARKALANCQHLIPKALRKKKISSAHVRPLVNWIEALQSELLTPAHLHHTLHRETAGEILVAYEQLQNQHPHHVSFSTAQHSKFLAYSIITTKVLQKFSPGKCSDLYLQNTHLLRYPFAGMPKTLKELFQRFPVKDDYDTASSLVGNALISVSPSLKEAESEESAWAIFENNERKGDVADCVNQIFEAEQVSPAHFRDRIKSLIKVAPKSSKGLIYTFFIPKNAPLHKALYLSLAYGIPKGDPLSENIVLDFYEQYRQGFVEENNSQLRFLPSALIAENDFDLAQIKSYRLTTIPQGELQDYAHKIERVVNRIYESHLEEMLQLTALASEVEALSDPLEKQSAYQKLCYRHLCRRDLQLALYYWHKLDDRHPQKASSLHGIIACLLKKNQLELAYAYFQHYEEQLVCKEQLIARFALTYIEQNNLPMFNLMLSKLSECDLRTFVLVLAATQYPEYFQECIPEEMESLMSDEDLINLGVSVALQSNEVQSISVNPI